MIALLDCICCYVAILCICTEIPTGQFLWNFDLNICSIILYQKFNCIVCSFVAWDVCIECAPGVALICKDYVMAILTVVTL